MVEVNPDKIQKSRIRKMTDYKSGDRISNFILDKIYFVNNEKNFIIAKVQNDDEIKVFGPTPTRIVHLLSECNYLTNNFVKTQKSKKMFEYQRAVAMNAYLIGEEEKSIDILNELLGKLRQKIVIKKKLYYIGVYLIIVILMTLVSINGEWIFGADRYIKYIKIATFGSFGGFIALNVKLKDIKFDISESTISYILVSLYKLVFAMISSIISYFFIESELILSVIKNNISNSIYLVYTIATLAGFSESFLPSIFKNLENNTVDSDKSKSE